MQIAPGETKSFKIKYKLPFKIEGSNAAEAKGVDFLNEAKRWLYADDTIPLNYYSLLLQKQLGGWPKDFTQRIVLPKNWKVIGFYPGTLKSSDNTIIIKDNLERDSIYGVLLNL